MTHATHLMQIVKHLSPWMLAGSASALSAIAGWAYLRILRILPWINLLVLVAGALLLLLEPMVILKSEHLASHRMTSALIPLLVSMGAFLLTLGIAGRWTIRRHIARETLRQRIWDRVSEQ